MITPNHGLKKQITRSEQWWKRKLEQINSTAAAATARKIMAIIIIVIIFKWNTHCNENKSLMTPCLIANAILEGKRELVTQKCNLITGIIMITSL